MWCYNILGDNRGRIPHLVWFDLITLGSVLLTSNTVFLKMENPDPILRVKSFEWIKSVDCFGLNIKAYPSRVVNENVFLSLLGLHQYHHPESSIYKGTIWTKSLIWNYQRYFCTD